MNKTELISAIRKARAEWEAAIAPLAEDQLLQARTQGDWSLKDVITHLTWHEKEMLGIIRAHALVGSELWNLPLHQRNNLIYLENKDRSLEDVYTEARMVYTGLLQALETLSDTDLNDPGQFPGMPPDWQPWKLIAENTYEHYQDHLKELKEYPKP
jgi:uncharacterized damage-inducible protein DinB